MSLCVACAPRTEHADTAAHTSDATSGGDASSDNDGAGTTDTAERGGSGPASTTDMSTTGCTDPEARVAKIFSVTCMTFGCHDYQAAGGLDLSNSDWAQQLIGQPSDLCDGATGVVVGNHVQSLLYAKIAGLTTCGSPMPVGTSLAADDIECIAHWIDQLPPLERESFGGTTCIDLTASAEHCGACNLPCPSSIPCVDSACACPDGTEVCGDNCIDPMIDPLHCGLCGHSCAPGLVCNQGECLANCDPLVQCDSASVDTDSNPLHCGPCDHRCESGSICDGGGLYMQWLSA